jgi:N-acetyl-anhydromuramyl-L-alanine amidase AmpD
MNFDIVNDRLEIDGKKAPFVKAHAFGDRFHPTMIVLHDTADRPVPVDTVRWFASKACTVSAHVVIERDGSITQMVPFDCKAFHAGKSTWNGKANCNGYAIGIEIDNPGKLDKSGRAYFHKDKKGRPIAPGFSLDQLQQVKTKEHGDGLWMPYTPEQIAAVAEFCRALVARYPTIKEIVTHYLISPGRKVDVNPLFPLDEVRQSVFATKGRSEKWKKAAYPPLVLGDVGDKVKAAQERLRDLSYPVGACDGQFGPLMRVAVLAFEAENGLEYDGVLNEKEHTLLFADTAKAMPLGARSEATAKDLRDGGSEIMLWCARIKRGILAIPLFGALFGGDTIANEGAGTAAVLDSVEQTRQQAVQVSDLFGWVLTPMGLIAIGVLLAGVGIYFGVDFIEKKRLKDHQSGANLGR